MTQEELNAISTVFAMALERAVQIEDINQKKQVCSNILALESKLAEHLKEKETKKTK